jgi:hypothetical protein
VKKKGMKVLKWDGMYVSDKLCGTILMSAVRNPVPILGEKGEVLVLLAGRPKDLGYCQDLSQLEAAMLEAKKDFDFSSGHAKNRRGRYRAISTGVTHGNGSKVGFSCLCFEIC